MKIRYDEHKSSWKPLRRQAGKGGRHEPLSQGMVSCGLRA